MILISKYLQIILLLIISIVFLSLKPKELKTKEGHDHKHEGYYDSGELRYVCYDHQTGTTGKGTGIIRKFKFKRLYFDKYGNIKLIVKGKGESGCWRNNINISEQIIRNEQVECSKEVFVYPDKSELEQDLKRGN